MPATMESEQAILNSTAEDARVAATISRLVSIPFIKMVVIDWKGKEKIKVQISAPSHPGLSVLLFRASTGTGRRFWKIGESQNQGRVRAPSALNIIIDSSPENIKTLVAAFDKLCWRGSSTRERSGPGRWKRLWSRNWKSLWSRKWGRRPKPPADTAVVLTHSAVMVLLNDG